MSWDVAETERAKARAEVLERELEDAHEIIRIAEKERVVLERELAAARREIDAQASRHDEELREATEATTRGGRASSALLASTRSDGCSCCALGPVRPFAPNRDGFARSGFASR